MLMRFLTAAGPAWFSPDCVSSVEPACGDYLGIGSVIVTAQGSRRVVLGLPDDVVRALYEEEVEPAAREAAPEDLEKHVEAPPAGGGVGAPAPLPEADLEEGPVVEGIRGELDDHLDGWVG